MRSTLLLLLMTYGCTSILADETDWGQAPQKLVYVWEETKVFLRTVPGGHHSQSQVTISPKLLTEGARGDSVIYEGYGTLIEHSVYRYMDSLYLELEYEVSPDQQQIQFLRLYVKRIPRDSRLIIIDSVYQFSSLDSIEDHRRQLRKEFIQRCSQASHADQAFLQEVTWWSGKLTRSKCQDIYGYITRLGYWDAGAGDTHDLRSSKRFTLEQVSLISYFPRVKEVHLYNVLGSQEEVERLLPRVNKVYLEAPLPPIPQ